MLLAIDVGNTNAVFAFWDGEKILAQYRCRTERGRTADEYFVWLQELIRHDGLHKAVDEVIVSSTVPQLLFNIREMSTRYFGKKALVVGAPDVELGLEVEVDPGTRVGPDRLVNTIAAFERHGGDLIVVDFGTATTFDVVGPKGAYRGGIIAPGVNLSLKALSDAAAALPHVDVARPEKTIGTNTIGSMQSGIFWGYVSLIEGLCKRIAEEYGKPMKVISTGGLAPLFDRVEGLFDEIDRDLTIHGLVAIAERNRK